ncbi:hypothetical protein D9M70_522130 [compost metagenome]
MGHVLVELGPRCFQVNRTLEPLNEGALVDVVAESGHSTNQHSDSSSERRGKQVNAVLLEQLMISTLGFSRRRRSNWAGQSAIRPALPSFAG